MTVEEGRVAEDLPVRINSMPRSFKKRGDGAGTAVGGRERGKYEWRNERQMPCRCLNLRVL